MVGSQMENDVLDSFVPNSLLLFVVSVVGGVSTEAEGVSMSCIIASLILSPFLPNICRIASLDYSHSPRRPVLSFGSPSELRLDSSCCSRYIIGSVA